MWTAAIAIFLTAGMLSSTHEHDKDHWSHPMQHDITYLVMVAAVASIILVVSVPRDPASSPDPSPTKDG